MRISDGILFIDPTIEQTDLKELYTYIQENYKSISSVSFDNNEPIVSSGLISLLISLKLTNDNISIDFLEKNNKEINLSGIGNLEIIY
jgi:hypothetical protein